MSRRPGLLALCLLTLALAGCRRQAEPRPALKSVSWRLQWNAARVQRTPQGLSWQTDLGYDVHLREGRLTTWRLGLERCPQAAAWSLVPSAWAHHVEPPDPTSLMPHLTEDVLALATTDLGPRTLPPAAYCRGLWLVSAPPQALAGDGPRVSLRLRGTWQRGAASGAFDLAPWLPDARFEQVAGLADADGAARIVLERQLADAWDGVELSGTATETLAWHLLHRLTSRAKWHVEPLP